MRQMSATVTKEASELDRLAGRAGEINRAQATADEVLSETERFVEELADRFGSAGQAPAPADAHDEILFYRALTDALVHRSQRSRRSSPPNRSATVVTPTRLRAGWRRR